MGLHSGHVLASVTMAISTASSARTARCTLLLQLGRLAAVGGTLAALAGICKAARAASQSGSGKQSLEERQEKLHSAEQRFQDLFPKVGGVQYVMVVVVVNVCSSSARTRVGLL